ncbi:hypothetical protein [Angustibacter aerolatus]
MSEPDPGAPRGRSAWRVAGIVVAVVLGVCGLVAVAGVLLFMLAINSWADSK